MPQFTFTELQTPKTQEQILDDLLAAMTAAGLPTTAWQPGSVPRTLLYAFSYVLAMLWALAAVLAGAGLLDYASGSWLTLLAKSRFSLDRIAATFARHSLTLSVASGAGPYTITPGQLLVTTAGGVRFRSTNTADVVVSTVNPQTVTVQAETAGTAGNSAPTVLVSPALAGLSFAYNSLTTRARDEESDPDLRTRCRAKWATLAGAGATRPYYDYQARSATLSDGVTNAGVTRTAFPTPAGDGTFTIVVAGSDGPLSGPQLTDATAYVTDVTRRAHTDTPLLQNAGAVLVTLACTVDVRAAYNTAANRLKAYDAVRALAASLAIGQRLDIGAVYAAIYKAEGVVNVTLTTPSADTVPTSSQVVTIDPAALLVSGNWNPVT